ncbi:MAG TPA: fumarylacetoacetate hydrolase family protein [Vicinamibacteria bacterium]|nr:fumarylacetoacetate hydrolase family protein [Vicinamibacteria bacterium]
MRLFRIATSGGAAWAKEEHGLLRLLEGDPVAGFAETRATVDLEGAKLLCPATPSKIVAVGLNYRDHAAEQGKPVPAEPLLFLKPPSAVIGPGEAIRLPAWAGRVDHEAELGLVIGRRAKDVETPEAAGAAILGAVCVNDVTARELQSKDVQYTRAKGFDTFCPIGPAMAVGLDLGRLRVECRVNGEVRQRSTTAELIFDPVSLVRFVSRVMTLLPGDIITTGTPAGVGPLHRGDRVEVEIEGIGVLENPVV